MKNFSKLMVTALLLTGVSGKLAAYRFNLTNKTDEDLRVSLSEWGEFKEIKSGETHELRTIISCFRGVWVETKIEGQWERQRNKSHHPQVCTNKNFDLVIIDEETGKIVVIEK